MGAAKSAAIRKPRHPYAGAKAAYDEGMPLSQIKRKFHLNDGELRDVAPEAFEDQYTGPEGIGGY